MSETMRHPDTTSPDATSPDAAELGSPRDDFEVDVSFGTDLVALLVHGDLNGETAAQLDGLIRAVVAIDHHRVVLDLADVVSIDAAVSGVIASSAAFAASHGGLTIHSASPDVRHRLAVAHMSSCVKQEPTRARRVLGSEETPGDRTAAVTRPTSRTLDDLRSFSRPEVDPHVLDAALELVVAVAARTIRGADGASITLRRDGTLITAAATDDTILELDRHQYATGEGPCLAAVNEGRWFHAQSLADETRWPAFAVRALNDGIRSVLSIPIRGPWRSVGALTVYSKATRSFRRPEQVLATLLATQASGIVADAGLGPFEVNLGIPAGVSVSSTQK